MVKVRIADRAQWIDVPPGTLLIDCLRALGISMETPCNCMGLCGKCKVKAKGELYPPLPEEAAFLKGEQGIRLACLARVKGDVELQPVEASGALKSIDKGIAVEAEQDSEIRLEELPAPDGRTAASYGKTTGKIAASINVANKTAAVYNEGAERVYGVCRGDVLLDISDSPQPVLGAAVDIGTTGISACLADMQNGAVLKRLSCLNPQTEFGGDVLTRITFAMNNEDGIEKLRDSIVNKINELLAALTEGHGSTDNIYRVMVAANTTMLHFFSGVDPRSIAKAPYRAVFLNKMDISAIEAGVQINREGIVTLLPSASSYIGADILAGIAATGFDKKEYPAIFIDIGTNGEIAALCKGRLAATSTAAGPALEGMNISCGMRAEEGAIDSFAMDQEGNISFSVIGDASPRGICGSGLLDIAASLARCGLLRENGRLESPVSGKFADRLRDKSFYITGDIYISQKDIRQIQLAKGAIAAGASMLLAELGIAPGEVREAVIAGAFGYHLKPESLRTIGLLPKGFAGEISFVGNSSLEGARLAMLSRSMLQSIESLQEAVQVIELSTREDFQKYFVQALSF